MSDSVFDFTKAHYLIVIRLKFDRPLSNSVVRDELYKLGLRWDDEDYGHMPRRDRTDSWQASKLCHVEYLATDAPTFCEGLVFEYFFSALPRCCQLDFLDLLGKAKELLGGLLNHENCVLTMQQMQDLFQRYNADLQGEFAEAPGSENLQRMLLEFRPIDWNWK